MRSVERRGEGVRLTVEARAVSEGTRDGDSIAVNGVCLTALDVRPGSFAADGSRETLQRSTLGRLRAGAVVNLERAVTPATRLGGHIVQGHVDARGRFLGAAEHGGSWTVRIAYPAEVAPYLVFKGSVAVEGISLTVAALAAEHFEVAVIPKTWDVTNLSTCAPATRSTSKPTSSQVRRATSRSAARRRRRRPDRPHRGKARRLGTNSSARTLTPAEAERAHTRRRRAARRTHGIRGARRSFDERRLLCQSSKRSKRWVRRPRRLSRKAPRHFDKVVVFYQTYAYRDPADGRWTIPARAWVRRRRGSR